MNSGRTRLLTLVVLGGTVGTGLRYLLGTALGSAGGGWPWATFTVNILGSFLLGLLLEALTRRGPDSGRRRALRLGLGTGLLGGFTTYSAFIMETDQLVAGGFVATAVAYAAGSIVMGILAAFAGVVLARAMVRRRTPERAQATAPDRLGPDQ